MRMIAIPKKAATIILLRKTEPKGFEVFLLKRHEKSSFMGGNYVYPGGRVDREDGRSDICSYCKGLALEDASHLFGGSMPPEESYAHWIAGIRELFEEAGVLLAYHPNGKMFQFQNQIERERFSKYRGLLQKGTLDICQMVQEENLLFALDRLTYYAHWITPEARS